MRPSDEANLIYRIIEFGMKKGVFTLLDLYIALGLTNEHGHPSSEENQLEVSFIVNYLINTDTRNVLPNQIIGEVSRDDPNHNQLHYKQRLLTSAIFQYEDYQEIKLARENAQEARKLSWIAIWISSVIGLLSLMVGGLELYH